MQKEMTVDEVIDNAIVEAIKQNSKWQKKSDGLKKLLEIEDIESLKQTLPLEERRALYQKTFPNVEIDFHDRDILAIAKDELFEIESKQEMIENTPEYRLGLIRVYDDMLLSSDPKDQQSALMMLKKDEAMELSLGGNKRLTEASMKEHEHELAATEPEKDELRIFALVPVQGETNGAISEDALWDEIQNSVTELKNVFQNSENRLVMRYNLAKTQILHRIQERFLHGNMTDREVAAKITNEKATLFSVLTDLGVTSEFSQIAALLKQKSFSEDDIDVFDKLIGDAMRYHKQLYREEEFANQVTKQEEELSSLEEAEGRKRLERAARENDRLEELRNAQEERTAQKERAHLSAMAKENDRIEQIRKEVRAKVDTIPEPRDLTAEFQQHGSLGKRLYAELRRIERDEDFTSARNSEELEKQKSRMNFLKKKLLNIMLEELEGQLKVDQITVFSNEFQDVNIRDHEEVIEFINHVKEKILVQEKQKKGFLGKIRGLFGGK